VEEKLTGKIIVAAIVSSAVGSLVGRGFFLFELSRGRFSNYDLLAASAFRAGGVFAIISFSFLLRRILSKRKQ
jgi:hypothetical protein